MTIAAGTRLGCYEIRSKIGEAGMGEVYLARFRYKGKDASPQQVSKELNVQTMIRASIIYATTCAFRFCCGALPSRLEATKVRGTSPTVREGL
jgi:serine/threonine protein kinase